ncbi:LysR substrate-binding domain-containing protein [Paraburkholderia sp. BL21I4N1]|uniref:LysR substrate-binding domain-containing protein n=1 Tax=Paraburkholderia sp. BL21I4N1 TaxID=1938801 RepID=UPI000CFC41ED|nr:LysR substrate-binding domain-containing protein [Paraburkholderia sp. BL21I4N1]PQV42745.1 LysR family transcriptional regulator [Paraburkholderia sp. BL21I4N1]
MEIRLEWLKAFRAIMQTGTATGATAIVFRTQPQVSRMISGLEHSLGFQLFTREGRRLIPTVDGLRFYSHIEPLLSNFDRLPGFAEDIKEKRGRPLVVAAEPFLLGNLVPSSVESMYRSEGTKFAIDLCVREIGLWVSRSNVDLAIVALPFTQTDLEQFSFAEVELVATIPEAHPLASKEVVDITELASQPFIALRQTTLLRSQIDVAAVGAGKPFRPIIETGSGATACELVARGVGVSISDPILASSFRDRGVVARRLTVPLKVTYGFLVNPSAALTQILQMAHHVVDTAISVAGDLVTTQPSVFERIAGALAHQKPGAPGDDDPSSYDRSAGGPDTFDDDDGPV